MNSEGSIRIAAIPISKYVNDVTLHWNCVTSSGWFNLPLNDNINSKILIMTKPDEILKGSGQNNELQEIAMTKKSQTEMKISLGYSIGPLKNKLYTDETHSCSCGGRYQNHQAGDPYSKTVFQCPMKCEGNKTYNVPGNCPVCNMHLEQVTEVHQQYYL
ncbi:MAG TPA: heavy metal-binding domain-containing protein [Anaerovoracaceae bacterium]|nr:heavy metal-binding domain-containing protein [Anaerovoracaceae bacterium]